MPRPNKPRTLGSERALSRRIALLCEQRGWKYAELADRMTAEGCPIQTSALYKLQGEPPRRVTVDELVALANVFDLTTDDLLRPIELVEREWAEDVAADFIAATRDLDDAQAGILRAALRLADVGRKSPDLYEYVAHQWQAASPARQWFAEFVGAEGVDNDELSRLADLSNLFWDQVLAMLEQASSKALEGE